MSQTSRKSPKFDLVKTFVFPALLVFLVPVFSYFFFFLHAQGRFDAQMRDAILQQIRADQKLTPEQRHKAIAFFEEMPFSQLLDNEGVAAGLPADTRFHYATFRWAILLSEASVLAGLGMFVLIGVCVALSLHSQFVQYLSLSVGWHVLRIFGACQAIQQGALLVALSFWLTALWFNVYSVKLILVVGFLAVAAVGVVIAAIFRRVRDEFLVAGQVLAPDESMPIWSELRRICARVGTEPPDHVIAGIDDNFFVTERAVIVGGETYRGRTLFVSLSLLKQLPGNEADAVLAHEMAHFSGQDTLYSRKIGPLLNRYDQYLQALHKGGVTLPIYYFMLCFRAFYQLSLGKLSRQREFRADRIAMEATSRHAFAGALLRTAAYTQYRNGVEWDLFNQERAMENANVCERIEQGFRQYAACFVAGPDIGQLAPAHPFDSHPPLSQRLQAIGVTLESQETHTLLATAGDGAWYHYVSTAEQIEKEQWHQYEEHFRLYHQQSLPYRFLPETAEELAIVESAFPPLTFAGKKGVLSVDHEKMALDQWPEPVRFADVNNLTLDDKVLKISYRGHVKRAQSLKTSTFANHQEVLNVIQNYYGRYVAAAQYQQQKKQKQEASSGDQGGSQFGQA